MKKLLALALIIFSANVLIAQNQGNQTATTQGKFKGGIMVNPFVSWSNASVDDPNVNKITNPGAGFGFAYGLVGDYFFNNNYGIDMNLRVSMFDDHFIYYPNHSSSNLWVDRTIHLQYVELPFCLKMRTNEVGYMKYFAQVGLMPAVKISAKADINSTDSLTRTGTTLNITGTNDVNVFMVYSVIGLGVEYNLGGTTNLVGSITWNNGFTNVWSKKADNTATDPHTYNNFNTPVGNIALNLGVLF
jgi:hypothetical protein